jgi:hypothetical protein
MRISSGGKGSMGAGIELLPKTTKRLKAKLAEMVAGVDIEDLNPDAEANEAEPPSSA